MIRLEGVSRVYPLGETEVHALRLINLHIPKGQFAAIMGPSGSGKSTLLHILGCLDRPTTGRFILDGEKTTEASEKGLVTLRRHKLGFIFQDFHLISRLNAMENVALPLVFSGVPPKERKERAQKVLSAVGLEDRMTHRPNQLSGGQRQRVAIARALVTDPPVLLADEPTGNLDSTSGKEVLEIIKNLQERGRTVVMVTHDPEAASFSQRVIRLKDGEVASDGTSSP